MHVCDRSKLYTVHQEMEMEQQGVQEDRTDVQLCSGDWLARSLGIQLCGEIGFPNASMQVCRVRL